MNEFVKRVLLPLGVAVGSLAVIVVVVFNLSRILIGLHDNNGPRWVVAFATVLGLALFGGFIYYASNKARKEGNSAVLASSGIIFIFMGFVGAEIIQAHDTHDEGGEDIGPAAATIIAVDNDFPEKTFSVAQNAVLGYKNEGNALHTLVAENAPAWEKLTVATNGAEAKGIVDLEPGDYVFFCDIPGHRASGMEATVTVTPPGSGGGGGGGGGGGDVAITSTQEITFEPTELTAAPGAKITLTNRGSVPHDFTIEGEPDFQPLVVSTDGETATGTLDLEPGEYVFFCSVPGHRQIGMEGTLTIAEGGGGGGAAPAGEEGAAPAGGTVVNSTEDIAFDPTTLTAPAGSKITLKNHGSLAHTLVLENVPAFTKLSVANDGEEASGTLDVEPGEYVFFCDLPGHRQIGMEGTLTVT
jgi:plastocyanin